MFKKTTMGLYLFLLVLIILVDVSAEKVCKFYYKGPPEQINTQELKMPEQTVAMSEYK